jgi:hypothetical protein
MPIEHRIYLFISGFVSIAQGLVTILTLTFYVPIWEFQWAAYYELWRLKSLQRKSQ